MITMVKLLLLLIATGCAHKNSPSTPEEELVSMRAAMDQAQASYLKGCVDGQKKLKVPLAFDGCRDMSLLHRQELEEILRISP